MCRATQSSCGVPHNQKPYSPRVTRLYSVIESARPRLIKDNKNFIRNTIRYFGRLHGDRHPRFPPDHQHGPGPSKKESGATSARSRYHRACSYISQGILLLRYLPYVKRIETMLPGRHYTYALLWTEGVEYKSTDKDFIDKWCATYNLSRKELYLDLMPARSWLTKESMTNLLAKRPPKKLLNR